MPEGSNGDVSNSKKAKKRNSVAKKKDNVMDKLNQKTKAIDRAITEINEAVPNIEESYDKLDGTITEIKRSIQELLSIYEILTIKINPFVDDSDKTNGGKYEKIEASVKEGKKPKKLPSKMLKDVIIEIPKARQKASQIHIGKPVIKAKEIRTFTSANDIVKKTLRAIIFAKWANFLLSRVGFSGALEAVMHYEEIGWLDSKTKDELIKYVKNLRHGRQDVKKPIGIDEHMGSLFYVSKLQGHEMNPKLYPPLLSELAELEYIE